MNFAAIFLLILLFPNILFAETTAPIDSYTDSKQIMLLAEKSFNEGALLDSVDKYQNALDNLKNLKEKNPDWNSVLVDIQIDRCKDKLKEIEYIFDLKEAGIAYTNTNKVSEISENIVIRPIEPTPAAKEDTYKKFIDIAKKADGFLAAEDYKTAVQYYNTALKYNPADKYVKTNKGIALFKAGNFKEAIDLFLSLIKEDSFFAPAIFNLADIYYSLEKYNDAIIYYEKAVEVDPDDIRSMINLGSVYVKSNSYNKGVDIFQKVIAKMPNSPDAYYNLGIIYADYLFDKSKAVYYFNKYLEFDSDSKSADEVREWLKMLE